MRKVTKDEPGFTLVDVLAALLIVSVLMAVVVPNFFAAQQDARLTARNTTVRSINAALALHMYQSPIGACPAAHMFSAFLANPAFFPDGPPVDPVAGGQGFFIANYHPALCRVVIPTPAP